MRGHRRKTAVFTCADQRGVFFRSDECDVIKLQLEIINRFADEVGVALADVFELRRGDAHEEHALFGVAEARGLEPCIERLAVDLLFERSEDAHPGIEPGGGGGDK